jgi:nucleoside-diphosphate-sugar epimerase
MRLAVTGGTGFVGAHLINAAVAAGHSVKALTRRDQPERASVDWVRGDLADRGALERLVESADGVIHVAGVINAQQASGFHDGNVAGTLTMLAAATAGGVQRFVQVSSLAAREPKLSLYGASKAEAEELVRGSGLDWSIVRPPAVYGPGDRETLELFKMARLGLMVMPPRGRISVIHVGDLVRLLLALAREGAPSNILIEPDDGKPGGWTHKEFARALGAAVGKKPLVVSAPGMLLRTAARADQLVRGSKAKLTADRAAYFCHPDWFVDPKLGAPAELWKAQVATAKGLTDTAAWYREQGWL